MQYHDETGFDEWERRNIPAVRNAEARRNRETREARTIAYEATKAKDIAKATGLLSSREQDRAIRAWNLKLAKKREAERPAKETAELQATKLEYGRKKASDIRAEETAARAKRTEEEKKKTITRTARSELTEAMKPKTELKWDKKEEKWRKLDIPPDPKYVKRKQQAVLDTLPPEQRREQVAKWIKPLRSKVTVLDKKIKRKLPETKGWFGLKKPTWRWGKTRRAAKEISEMAEEAEGLSQQAHTYSQMAKGAPVGLKTARTPKPKTRPTSRTAKPNTVMIEAPDGSRARVLAIHKDKYLRKGGKLIE